MATTVGKNQYATTKQIEYLVLNEDKLKEKLERFKIKSEKLGIEFAYIIDKLYLREDEKGNQYRRFLLGFTLPELGDYKIIALLEVLNKKNYVSVVDWDYAELISKNVRNFTTQCDHCGQNRNRRYIYLIWDEKNKRILQVGKSCSKEFIKGLDVDMLYNYVDTLTKILDADYTKQPRGVKKFKYYNVNQVIDYALKYISYKDAQFKGEPGFTYQDYYRRLNNITSMINSKDFSVKVIESTIKKLITNEIKKINNNEKYPKLMDTDESKFKGYYFKQLTKAKDKVGTYSYNVNTFLDEGLVRDEHIDDIINSILKEYKAVIKLRAGMEELDNKDIDESNMKLPESVSFREIENIVFGMYYNLGIRQFKKASDTDSTKSKVENFLILKENDNTNSKLREVLEPNKIKITDNILKYEDYLFSNLKSTNPILEKSVKGLNSGEILTKDIGAVASGMIYFLNKVIDKKFNKIGILENNKIGEVGDTVEVKFILETSTVETRYYKDMPSYNVAIIEGTVNGEVVKLEFTSKLDLLERRGFIKKMPNYYGYDGANSYLDGKVHKGKEFKIKAKIKDIKVENGRVITIMNRVSFIK